MSAEDVEVCFDGVIVINVGNGFTEGVGVTPSPLCADSTSSFTSGPG